MSACAHDPIPVMHAVTLSETLPWPNSPERPPVLNCASGDQDTQSEGDRGNGVPASAVSKEHWFVARRAIDLSEATD